MSQSDKLFFQSRSIEYFHYRVRFELFWNHSESLFKRRALRERKFCLWKKSFFQFSCECSFKASKCCNPDEKKNSLLRIWWVINDEWKREKRLPSDRRVISARRKDMNKSRWRFEVLMRRWASLSLNIQCNLSKDWVGTFSNIMRYHYGIRLEQLFQLFPLTGLGTESTVQFSLKFAIDTFEWGRDHTGILAFMCLEEPTHWST